MVALDLDKTPAPDSVIGEKALRRQIDCAVSRAMFDAEYASLLLADPTLVLEDHACPPQQYLSLLSIQASDVTDFARQAWALFWMSRALAFDAPPNTPQPAQQEEHRALSAVATP